MKQMSENNDGETVSVSLSVMLGLSHQLALFAVESVPAFGTLIPSPAAAGQSVSTTKIPSGNLVWFYYGYRLKQGWSSLTIHDCIIRDTHYS